MKTLSIHTVLGALPRTLSACALATSAVLLAPSESFACKCAPPPSPTEAMQQATAVFEAQVTQLDPAENELEVSMNVVRAWKGVDAETIRLRTQRDTAACGVPFEMGRSYLVYAAPTTAGTSTIALEAQRCGRTRLAEEADEDFSALGIGVVPVSAREPATARTPAPPPRTPPLPKPVAPAVRGCASCNATGAGGHAPPAFALVTLTGLVFLRRRHRHA